MNKNDYNPFPRNIDSAFFFNRSRIAFCCLWLISLVSNYSAFGQIASADSVAVNASEDMIYQQYIDEVENHSHLYNGTEYVNYDKPYIQGDQFFESNLEAAGGIYYDGFYFRNVPLLYDIYVDQLVIKHPASPLKMKLVNEKVKYFVLYGHTFVRLVSDSLTASPIRTGFYDLLFASQVKVLAKRAKDLQERATPTGLEGRFNEIDKFFIEKNKTYYQVGKKYTVVKLFPNKKSDLRKYVRSQKLKFTKNRREDSIVKLVRYYSTLPQSSSSQN
ncbi:hypothetical protein [Hymenobacter sp. BT491]|uniref:hypothetical protein n=1 Tax=Hymenobacter sp. BT491 TaxID=2766779 RepID=UPI001653709F|nr:hypothetical protein [Hymenobacter sp. BT491]MBC6988776.1 hypothetical protein [Hymenobacter sp. BT491]